MYHHSSQHIAFKLSERGHSKSFKCNRFKCQDSRPRSRDSGRPRLGWNEGGRNGPSAYEISWNDHRWNQRLKKVRISNSETGPWFSSLLTPGYVFSKPLASASKAAWWNVKTTYRWLGAHDLYSSVHRFTNGTRCPERIAGWKLTHSIGTPSLPDIQKLCACWILLGCTPEQALLLCLICELDKLQGKQCWQTPCTSSAMHEMPCAWRSIVLADCAIPMWTIKSLRWWHHLTFRAAHTHTITCKLTKAHTYSRNDRETLQYYVMSYIYIYMWYAHHHSFPALDIILLSAWTNHQSLCVLLDGTISDRPTPTDTLFWGPCRPDMTGAWCRDTMFER